MGIVVKTVIAALTLWILPAATEPIDYRAVGDDHYFNLEYDQALRAYYRAIETEGESAKLWTHIATTILYQELHRLGKLETSAFKAENEFLGWEKPDADPEAGRRFLGAVGRAKELAEERLAENPEDAAALLALSNSYALEANYDFMVEKSYLAALRKGNRARRHSEQVRKLQPDIVDAQLVTGVQEYVIGSLPWAVRTMVAVGGIRGNKKKGIAMVKKVAADGDSLQTEARVLMTLVHRREGRPREAAELLRALSAEFPRNYVLRLEWAEMLLAAGDKRQALEMFRKTRSMVAANEHSFGRMPERLQKALDLKIEALEEETVQGSARG